MEEAVIYPTTTALFLKVAGIALFAGAVTTWLRKFLPDWRLTPVLVLVVSIATSAAAAGIQYAGDVTWSRFFSACANGFWGATLATFGYEGIANILSFINVRPRTADRALDAARELRDTLERKTFGSGSRSVDRVLMSTSWLRERQFLKARRVQGEDFSVPSK